MKVIEGLAFIQMSEDVISGTLLLAEMSASATAESEIRGAVFGLVSCCNE